MLLSAIAAVLPSGSPAGGAPLYPDLRTAAPNNLSLQRGGDGRLRLRFDNMVGNYGGRLEMTVPSGSREIYQNVYDENEGGARVDYQRVASDLVYHPTHSHFHFADFAMYELLRRNSVGAYLPTSRIGSKTSFCILDSVRVGTHGPARQKYTSCGANLQGLSAGWADIYDASLPEQWIDLGTAVPSDGSYAIRSTADPYNRLMETDNDNNVGLTYFTITNGQIIVRGTPPTCVLDDDRAPVGATVRLSCNRFGAGETVDIYWGSVNTDPRTTVTSTTDGKVSAQIAIPRSALGVHYVIARSRSNTKQSAAVFNTIPSVVATPTRGIVGSNVDLRLDGFSEDEQVQVAFYKTTTIVSSTQTATVDGGGGVSLTIPIPAAPYGRHKVEATGLSSGAKAVAYVSIAPSISLIPDTAPAGGTVSVSLRGFSAGELVDLVVARDGTVLTQVTTSHSGSVTASSASFTIPESNEPGTYRIFATGATSGVVARTFLAVALAGSSEDEVKTPSPSATPRVDPTSTPVPTETVTIEPTLPPEATATVESGSPAPDPTDGGSPVPNASPVADGR